MDVTIFNQSFSVFNCSCGYGVPHDAKQQLNNNNLMFNLTFLQAIKQIPIHIRNSVICKLSFLDVMPKQDLKFNKIIQLFENLNVYVRSNTDLLIYFSAQHQTHD